MLSEWLVSNDLIAYYVPDEDALRKVIETRKISWKEAGNLRHSLTRHGGMPPNLIQSALPVPACRLFQQVAGFPSLASSGLVRVFLAAAAATSCAAGLNILSSSGTRSTTADLQLHSSTQASM